MTRTTLDLDASVLRELRRRSKRARKSMGAVASELLSRALRETEAVPNDRPFHWLARDLGVPLVDLEDKEAVRAVLDRGE